MPPDYERYRKHVEHFDLTHAVQDELIHTVHSMMESFVDRRFGVDPAQLCIDLKASKDASSGGDVIDLALKKPAAGNLQSSRTTKSSKFLKKT